MCCCCRNECTEVCKTRQQELESELKQIRRELKVREDQIRQLDRETQVGGATYSMICCSGRNHVKFHIVVCFKL